MARKDDWDYTYSSTEVEKLPWYNPKLDADLKTAIKDLQMKKGKFLDIGTGPGTQAIGLAKLGFSVIALDISTVAIEKAKVRAKNDGVNIRFLVDDILNTKLRMKQFDFILDRGVFHTIDPNERPKYVSSIKELLKEDGLYFMKCFSTKTLGTWGPHRFTKEQIIDYFSYKFKIISIKDSIFADTLDQKPKTLFCIMRSKH